MLKAYAVALVMTTSAPVADKKEETVKAQELNKPVVAKAIKIRTGGWGGIGL